MLDTRLLCSECQIDGEDFVNFCGLLRKHELYGRSIFCLLLRPKFSYFFDLCLHWVSVVRVRYSSKKIFFKIVIFFTVTIVYYIEARINSKQSSSPHLPLDCSFWFQFPIKLFAFCQEVDCYNVIFWNQGLYHIIIYYFFFQKLKKFQTIKSLAYHKRKCS